MSTALIQPPQSISDAACDGPTGERVGRDALQELAAACGRGDRAAFERLHERFSRGISGFFAGRGAGAAEVEDLTQRVWTAVWLALSTGRYDAGKASISTFLYGVASKAWLQYLRERGRRRSDKAGLDDALAEVAGGDPDPGEAMPGAELLERLRGYLRQRGDEQGSLSEEEYEVIMSAARGMSDRELAARLSVAPSTVNARKQAGWGKVRRFLARLGYREESAERREGTGE